ncbi:MAG: hypothetical protein EPN92_14360 [Chitinophagaceae bacterium]|nr:MAG: hypothetical protein EPN92_14360 [Chitinophagaceae bacterium]
MKRFYLLLLILIAAAILFTYVFIPSKIDIRSVAESSMNSKAAYRFLLEENNWTKWWPGPKAFYFNNTNFWITKKKLNSFEMQLVYKKDSVINNLEMIPLSGDSTEYTWSCEIESGNDPLTRWKQYFKALHIKKNLDTLIYSLKNSTDKEENVYGFKVQKIKVTDSVLISTRSLFNHYPDEKETGSMVQKLKDYIKTQKAVEKNFPMLNVNQTGPDNYEAMVAIATDKKLPETKDFTPKLVLKGGNILEAEFKGGPIATRKAFTEFENYKLEMQYISPAIPYQLMIIDRAKESDTTKWVTKFYYPVF